MHTAKPTARPATQKLSRGIPKTSRAKAQNTGERKLHVTETLPVKVTKVTPLSEIPEVEPEKLDIDVRKLRKERKKAKKLAMRKGAQSDATNNGA